MIPELLKAALSPIYSEQLLIVVSVWTIILTFCCAAMHTHLRWIPLVVTPFVLSYIWFAYNVARGMA